MYFDNHKILTCFFFAVVRIFFFSSDLTAQTDSTIAMNLFLTGEKHLIESRLDSAEYYYNQAGGIFLKAGIKGRYFHTRFYTANLYAMKGMNKKADSLFKISLRETKKILGMKDPILSLGYQLYGRYLFQLSEIDSALYYLRLSLQSNVGEDCKNLKFRAHNYINIGNCWIMKENFDSALYYYNACYNIRQKCYPPNHLEIASILNNLGLISYKTTDFDNAEKYFSTALNMQIISLGNNNLNVATCYLNLGNIYIEKSDYDAALLNYTESFNIRLRILGLKNVETLTVLNNMANVFLYKNESDKALEVNFNVLENLKELLGEENPGLVSSYVNIANCYQKQKNYLKAVQFYKTGIDLRAKALGDSTIGLALLYENLSENYKMMAKLEKEKNKNSADSLLNLSYYFIHLDLTIKKQFLGTENVSYAKSLLHFSTLFYAKNETENAVLYLNQAINILLKDEDVRTLITKGDTPRLNPNKIISQPMLLEAFEIKGAIYEGLAGRF